MDQPALRAFGDIQTAMKSYNLEGPIYEKGDRISSMTGEKFIAVFKGDITGDMVGRAREIVEGQGVSRRMAVRIEGGNLRVEYLGQGSHTPAPEKSMHENVVPPDMSAEGASFISTADVMIGVVNGKPSYLFNTPLGRMAIIMEIKQAEEMRDTLDLAIRKAKGV